MSDAWAPGRVRKHSMHTENVAIATGCHNGIVIEISDAKMMNIKSRPETGTGLINRGVNMLRAQYVIPRATYILVVEVFIVVLLVRYFEREGREERAVLAAIFSRPHWMKQVR